MDESLDKVIDALSKIKTFLQKRSKKNVRKIKMKTFEEYSFVDLKKPFFSLLDLVEPFIFDLAKTVRESDTFFTALSVKNIFIYFLF